MESLYADLDKIVFEGREKSYGGYQMRLQHNRLLVRSALIAFLLFLCVTTLPQIIGFFRPVEVEETTEIVKVITELPTLPPVVDLTQPDIPNLPEVQPPRVNMATTAFNVPNPVEEEQIAEEETIRSIEELEDVNIGAIDNEGDESITYNFDNLDFEVGLDIIDDPQPPVTDEGPGMWDHVPVEKEPFPIDMGAFKKRVGYPPLAIEADIEGTVTARIKVDKFGMYERHAILKSPHPLLTKAVEDQIKTLRFTPGIQAGNPIGVWITIPVKFTLNR